MGIWDIVKNAADEIVEKAVEVANDKISKGVSGDVLDDRTIAEEAIGDQPLKGEGPSGMVKKALSAGASMVIKSSKKMVEAVVSKYQPSPPVHDILDKEIIESIITTLSPNKKIPINLLIDLACNNTETLQIAFRMDDKRHLNFDNAIKKLEMEHDRDPQPKGNDKAINDLNHSREVYQKSEISLKLKLLRMLDGDTIPTYDDLRPSLTRLNDNYPNWKNTLLLDALLTVFADDLDSEIKLTYVQKALSIKPLEKSYLRILQEYHPGDLGDIINQLESL